MSDTHGEQFGPRLAAYIDRRRGEASVRQFAADHNLDHVQISKWRAGSTPGIAQLRQVADGLGLPLGQLLVLIGAGTAADFTVVHGPADPSVEQAVDSDPDLLDHERVMLRDFLAMLRKVRAGQESVTVRSRPRRKQ